MDELAEAVELRAALLGNQEDEPRTIAAIAASTANTIRPSDRPKLKDIKIPFFFVIG